MNPIEGNIKSIGKIHIMPRKVYWIGIPESIKDKDRIEFLSKDIWTINHPLDKIQELENEKDVILFLNLDYILLKGRKIHSNEFIQEAKMLIKEIQGINPLHAIAHTTHINPQLALIFKNNSISYIEKNLHEINSAMSTVIKTVDLIYEKTNRVKREHLRIEVVDSNSIPIRCHIEKSKREFIFAGFVKNLSMGGLQIGFDNDSFKPVIAIRDIVELTFPLGSYQIKVQKAIIARIDTDSNSVGVYFDIKNEKMIRDFHANQYIETIYHWIKEVTR